MAHKGGTLFTLRKHWKKSVFGAVVLSQVTRYAKDKYREHQIRREVFTEARGYGQQPISPMDKPRRLYVILNPQASKGKCKALFQKNAAPILHLAGIDVTLIQTDYEGHAKTTVNYFDPTIDGIVVAGGNGSLQETVTGMLRQRTEDNISALPIGFIPLGRSGNSVFKKLFTSDEYEVRSVCKATMAIVRGHYKETSVMEISTESKPVYALSHIHFGAYQEVKQKIDAGKYWLLGPLKTQFAFMWRTVRNWPPAFSISLKIRKNNETMSGVRALDWGETDNFSIYLQEDVDSDADAVLVVQKRANDISRVDFIRVGWEWLANKLMYTSHELSDTVTCAEVELRPGDGDDDGPVVSYDIDGETFDARPVTVRVDARKLKVFCNPDGG